MLAFCLFLWVFLFWFGVGFGLVFFGELNKVKFAVTHLPGPPMCSTKLSCDLVLVV